MNLSRQKPYDQISATDVRRLAETVARTTPGRTAQQGGLSTTAGLIPTFVPEGLFFVRITSDTIPYSFVEQWYEGVPVPFDKIGGLVGDGVSNPLYAFCSTPFAIDDLVVAMPMPGFPGAFVGLMVCPTQVFGSGSGSGSGSDECNVIEFVTRVTCSPSGGTMVTYKTVDLRTRCVVSSRTIDLGCCGCGTSGSGSGSGVSGGGSGTSGGGSGGGSGSGEPSVGGFVTCCGRTLSGALQATLSTGDIVNMGWDGSSYWQGGKLPLSCGEDIYLRMDLDCNLYYLSSATGGSFVPMPGIGVTISCGPPFRITGTFTATMTEACSPSVTLTEVLEI